MTLHPGLCCTWSETQIVWFSLAHAHFFTFQNFQPRKRTKKLSHAAQIQQTMEGCIDLETPDSILVNTNLKVSLVLDYLLLFEVERIFYDHFR